MSTTFCFISHFENEREKTRRDAEEQDSARGHFRAFFCIVVAAAHIELN